MITINFNNSAEQEICVVFNETYAFLETQHVEKIELCRDAPATTVEYCLSTYDFARYTTLSRVLNIARECFNSINRKEVLSTVILGRALLETIAHFHNFLNRFENHLKLNESNKAYYTIATYALMGKHSPECRKFKFSNICDSVDELDKTYKGIRESYDMLCEFVHPNSMGTAVAFAKIDRENGYINFSKTIPFARGTSIILESIILFPVFKSDWQRTSKIRNLIETNWKPSETVCDLFDK